MASAIIETAVLIAIGVPPSGTHVCIIELPISRPTIAVTPQPNANQARYSEMSFFILGSVEG